MAVLAVVVFFPNQPLALGVICVLQAFYLWRLRWIRYKYYREGEDFRYPYVASYLFFFGGMIWFAIYSISIGQ